MTRVGQAGLPDLVTVPEFLAHYAAVTPAAVAWSARSAYPAAGVSLTYQDAQRSVEACAGGLAALGVRPGDIVGVYGNSRPECLAVFLACCRAGAIFLGLSPKYSGPELEFICGDAQPALLCVLVDELTDAQAASLRGMLARTGSVRGVVSIGLSAAAAGRPVIALGEFLGAGQAAPDPATDPAGPCAIVYTSGSTGAPKGALLSQTGMLRSAALTWRHWYGGLPEVRTVAQHPVNHVGWLVCECVTVLTAGGALYFRERFDGAATLKLIEQERLNLWLAFPSMVILAMQTPEFEDCDLTSLRRIAFGMPPTTEVMTRLRAKTSAVFSVSYGLTEAHGGSATVTDDDADLAAIPTSIGRVLPGVRARVVDDAGQDVPPGEPGEFLLRDSSVFLGYLNRPEATAETLRDGWLHTGDIVAEQPDGQFEFISRKKEMFKSGGYNVYPREIEGVICGHPDVSEAAVVAVPDPLWQEVGLAFVIPREGASLDVAELASQLRASLANYKIPKHFVVLDRFPELPNGKFDKVRLRERGRRIIAGEGGS